MAIVMRDMKFIFIVKVIAIIKLVVIGIVPWFSRNWAWPVNFLCYCFYFTIILEFRAAIGIYFPLLAFFYHF